MGATSNIEFPLFKKGDRVTYLGDGADDIGNQFGHLAVVGQIYTVKQLRPLGSAWARLQLQITGNYVEAQAMALQLAEDECWYSQDVFELIEHNAMHAALELK